MGRDVHRARGNAIKAWLLHPPADAPLPCRVEFIGYGGGRGLPLEHTLYPACGHATFVMDTRGQGGTWAMGATGDAGDRSEGPEHPVHADRVETLERTLDYVDNAHLARRIRARTFAAVGLIDTICPPSTVFARYNAIEAEKEIFMSRYGGHTTAATYHEQALALFARHLRA